MIKKQRTQALRKGYFELIFYRICIIEFGEMVGQFILQNWYWFLDDCKTPLERSKIYSNRLLEILNSINPSIKFTIETSNKELLFLDILIKRNHDKIWMDIYLKPTDFLVGVSQSRPAIQTIVRKTYHILQHRELVPQWKIKRN